MGRQPGRLTLSEGERRVLAVWAADCAERTLPLFEAQARNDTRPRDAIDGLRAFARGEMRIGKVRALAARAHAAAREVGDPAAVAAARAAGQAASVAHMAAHARGVAYAAKATGLAAPHDPTAAADEIQWQASHASPTVRQILRRLPPPTRSTGLLGALINDLLATMHPVSSGAATLRPFYDGWANYQRLLLAAVRKLTPEQLGLRTAPHLWAVWQLAGHMAGARTYWFHDVLGEGDPALRDMFRVASTTAAGLPLEDAGWEDDENHPRGPAEIVEALERTWAMIDDCLQRWTPDDLAVEFSRHRRSDTQIVTRQWVTWHLMEHDLHHGGEISLILGSHGLPGLDL